MTVSGSPDAVHVSSLCVIIQWILFFQFYIVAWSQFVSCPCDLSRLTLLLMILNGACSYTMWTKVLDHLHITPAAAARPWKLWKPSLMLMPEKVWNLAVLESVDSLWLLCTVCLSTWLACSLTLVVCQAMTELLKLISEYFQFLQIFKGRNFTDWLVAVVAPCYSIR